jgi:hypothetical protein
VTLQSILDKLIAAIIAAIPIAIPSAAAGYFAGIARAAEMERTLSEQGKTVEALTSFKVAVVKSWQCLVRIRDTERLAPDVPPPCNLEPPE